MAWIWTWPLFLSLTTLAFLALQQFTNRNSKQKKLPPGPRGLPIIGSIHLLGKSPHRNLFKLAQRHGPIMHLRLGQVPTIIVSSSEAAESFLKTHDLNFATRPPHESARQFLYNQKSMSFVPYGSYWRNIRKMVTLELLSSRKITSFKDVREEELGLFMRFVREVSEQRVPIDVSAKVASLGADVTCRMIVGKKYSDQELDPRGFKGMISEAMKLMGTPNFGDYIPQIAPLDLQGLKRKIKAVSQVFDRFLDGIIDDHIQSRNGHKSEDLVDVMLGFLDSEGSEYQICRDDVKAIILDLIVASMDTSAAIIEWCLSELIKQPEIMTKLQNELEGKVSLDRTVEESDIDKLEYLSMVVRETFRLHPPVPLLLPHAAREECDINGFYIPKNSHVIFNAWAIGRDPGAWVDPEKFWPERFRGSEVDVRGRDFQLIPFGSGRRGCPGMQLALVFVHLVVANMVHSFEWELPGGMLPHELDMTEEYGLVMPKATHLIAIPSYRLHIG